ncbi:MAG: tRNA dihydrouridine(16) synthase DusC [Gammaproteobacteria bacterium]|nr:tRNA dihydrouridine(16) synthase DusC [Gammaproteobacteria bacterium]NKB61116.1 tRNA dihydrouridine(16) synthase DusC [Gammaproteobacteria bacterium]
MRIILAPMQGVIDYQMRELLTSVGGYDRCVTEFVRVTDHRVPEKVFFRYCPELETGGRTKSGIPVYLQLLGGDPKSMGLSARCAASLGAPGIDINFGCPAKTVNRHDGGSVLLKKPQRVFEIIHAVRENVSEQIPVSAKIRLGFEDDTLLSDIIGSAAEAGATELCIHARTRTQGYKAPAYWSAVGQVQQPAEMPITINGEIWTPSDVTKAMHQSNSEHIMLARGALSCPDLALQTKAWHRSENYTPMDWSHVVELVRDQFNSSTHFKGKYVGNRTKQWLSYLMRHYSEASSLFHRVKRCIQADEIMQHLNEQAL